MSAIKFTHKPDLKTQVEWCLNRWDSIYDKWRDRKNVQEFIQHDGPPYANGDIHMGHAVNKTLKDCINRFMAMKGYRVNYLLGWDCHGLPIEAKVEAEFRKKGLKPNQIDVHELRKACADFAQHWITVQGKSFKQLGIIAGRNYYTTMSAEGELGIIELIHKFARKELIFQSLKPVMWSCSEGTALAEAEVEYMMKESTAIDVSVPISFSPIPELNNRAFIPIWTTTPWTLPANRAIAYNKDFVYSIVSAEDRTFVVAKDLLARFQERIKLDLTLIKEIQGDELEKTICLHPLYDCGFKLTSALLESNHVNTEQGTGFVHIAPDFGLDDFNVAKRENIQCCHYLNDNGYFSEELPEYLAGRFYSDVEPDIITRLSERHYILSVDKITHSYPHSWRSRKPLIQRATDQWFIKLDDPQNNLRGRAVESVEQVKWLPASAKERFLSMLTTRESWCISRQRSWGTPIALFYHHKTKALLLDEVVFARTMDYLAKHGVGAWWNADLAENVLPSEYMNDYVPIKDIIDVWFEAGATQHFVLRKNNIFPADLYLEGSDQHRAWFQASLLTSCLDGAEPPYKCVKTHGYVVDQNKAKMSKSLGNGKDPSEVIESHGPDALRLWVLRQDATNDVTWSNKQLDEVEKIQNKIRNTIKFLIAHAKEGDFSYDEMHPLERWVLHKAALLQQEAEELDQNWNIHTFVHKVHEFCDGNLSRLYFDIRKDALYWEDKDSLVHRQAMHCMHLLLHYLLRWIAPIIPFTADEAWNVYLGGKGQSIHLETYLPLHKHWNDEDNYETVENLIDLREKVYKVLEPIRNEPDTGIRSSLDAHVTLHCPEDNILASTEAQGLMKSIAIISQLTVVTNTENLGKKFDLNSIQVQIKASDGYKCTKCKRRVPQLSEQLCIRCTSAVTEPKY